jgi:hypothetical protein
MNILLESRPEYLRTKELSIDTKEFREKLENVIDLSDVRPHDDQYFDNVIWPKEMAKAKWEDNKFKNY